MATTTGTAPTIKIADEVRLRPVRAETIARYPSVAVDGNVGGIYHSRTLRPSVSHPSIARRRSLSRISRDRRADTAGDVEEGDRWQDGQMKTKQVFRGRTLLWCVCRRVASLR